jgi:hypothetical protein
LGACKHGSYRGILYTVRSEYSFCESFKITFGDQTVYGKSEEGGMFDEVQLINPPCAEKPAKSK